MTKQFDVIIIGGGATGAGVARDCSLRGIRALLLERGDIDWFNRAYKAGIDFYGFSAVVTNMTDGGVSGTLSLKKESKDRLLSFKKKYNNTLVVYLHLYRWYLIAFKNQIHRTLRKYKISNKG